jgi:hypothetical protein
MEHQGMADERLNKAEQQLTEANRRADEATKQIERSAMEHQMMADERLNKIEQQLTEANRRADEATKRVENLTMEHQMMAEKRAAEQLAELEQKFMDTMIRMERNSAERMERNSAERMDMNHVENLLHPQAEIAESLNNDNDNDMGSEDRGFTAVQKGKEKMVRLKFSLRSFGLNFLLKVPPPRRKYSRPPGGATSIIISMEQPSHTQPYRSPSPFQLSPSPSPFQQVHSPSPFQQVRSPSPFQEDDGMNFARQVSGWGSAAIHVEPVARNRSQSVASTASPEPFEPTKPHSRHRGKTSQKYPKPIFGEGAEESRSSTRPSRVIHRQSTLRGFSTTRAAQLVRFIYINNLAQKITLCCLGRRQDINEQPHGHRK